MQKHTKIYLNHFGYTEADWIVCEIPDCGKEGVDIHHIKHGANGRKNNIENLMALCLNCHIKAHLEKPGYRRDELQKIHNSNLYSFLNT